MDFNNFLDPIMVGLANQIVDNIENAEAQVQNLGHVNPNLEIQDPFEVLSEEKFKKTYRLNKREARNLINLITPYLRAPQREYSINVDTKVLFVKVLIIHFLIVFTFFKTGPCYSTFLC